MRKGKKSFSRLRRQVLPSLPAHLLNLSALYDPHGELLQRGSAGMRLREMQGRAEGVGTWRAMRDILPAGVWARRGVERAKGWW